MNAKRQVPKRVALYVRTSTANGQTTKNQERELQTVAERHGWQVVTVYRDQGISGAKGRDRRPGLNRLMQAVTRTPKLDHEGKALDHQYQNAPAPLQAQIREEIDNLRLRSNQLQKNQYDSGTRKSLQSESWTVRNSK